MEVRRQILSLYSYVGFRDQTQALRQQGPLPSDPSCWPWMLCFKGEMNEERGVEKRTDRLEKVINPSALRCCARHRIFLSRKERKDPV